MIHLGPDIRKLIHLERLLRIRFETVKMFIHVPGCLHNHISIKEYSFPELNITTNVDCLVILVRSYLVALVCKETKNLP